MEKPSITSGRQGIWAVRVGRRGEGGERGPHDPQVCGAAASSSSSSSSFASSELQSSSPISDMQLRSALLAPWTLPLHIKLQGRTVDVGFERPFPFGNPKLASASQRQQLKVSCQSTHFYDGFLPGEVITEAQGQSSEEASLIDIEESTNGFVLFKFGTTDVCNEMDLHTNFSEKVDKWEGFPSKNLTSYKFSGGIMDSSLSKDAIKSSVGDGCKTVHLFEPSTDQRSPSFTPKYATSDNKFDSLYQSRPTESSDSSSETNKQLSQPLSSIKRQELVNCPSYFPLGCGIVIESGNDVLDFLLSHNGQIRSENRIFIQGLHGLNSAIMTENVERLPSNFCHEHVGIVKPQLIAEVACGTKTSSTKRTQTGRKKIGHQQRKTKQVVAQDLCRRSSFQLYEVILSYPFMNSSRATSKFQTIPKEKFRELFNIVNQVAVGLAGSGLALVLFVASRMLSLNATLDGSKAMYLLRGIGLLWLSSALQNLGATVMCMAEVCTKARPQRKEEMARFRTDVQAVTFKACTLAMLSLVKLV